MLAGKVTLSFSGTKLHFSKILEVYLEVAVDQVLDTSWVNQGRARLVFHH